MLRTILLSKCIILFFRVTQTHLGSLNNCHVKNNWRPAPQLKYSGHSRVVLSGENSEPKYSNYLCFVVSVQTNKLMSEYGGKYGGIAYTESQQQTHDLIKSLHESGLGYRRIAQHLNSKNITTLTGKEWKGNHVFAVLKRYRQREERLSRREEVFEPEISKFEVRWERNY